MKHVLMGTSSNFGNTFSPAGASILVAFLPMPPSQILLKNMMDDSSQLAIPTDEVDPELVARPARWDVGFIRKFMIFFGPIGSGWRRDHPGGHRQTDAASGRRSAERNSGR
jgi:P-type Mg2+ transporter